MGFLQRVWARYLELLAFITLWFEDRMEMHGRLVSRFPVRVAVISFLVAVGAGLGLLNIRSESDGEKLWVPQNSVSLKYQDYAEDQYQDSDRFATIIFGADKDGNDNNVLDDSTFIYSVFAIDEEVKNINENGVTYENGLCLEAEPGRCVQSGVLEFWDNTITEYDSQVGGNSTEPGDQMQLLEDINVEVFSDNSQVIQETIFYRPEYDESGNLVRAELAQVNYVFRSTSGESTFEDWASEFHDVLEDAQKKYGNVELYYSTSYSFEEELDKAITGDIYLIALAFVAITILTMGIFFRRNQVQSRVSLGAVGVFAVALSIAMGYGLSSILEIPFTSLTSILPFILVGIGVDDIFVLASGLENAKSTLPAGSSVEDLTAHTMRTAGLSVTVTSLTNLLAFLLGSATSIPAIRWFCWYAALSVASDYFLQVTFFMSFLVFTERRIAKKQYDLAPCCMSADDDDEEKQQPQQQPPKEGKDSAKPTSTEFVEWFREKPLKWYASFITGKTGSLIVLLVHFGFAALCIVGVTDLEEGLPTGDLAPDGSYFKDFMEKRDDTFNRQVGQATFIYFRFFDQSDPTNQEAMYLCWQDTLGNDNIDQSTSPDETWLSEYTAFVESQGVTLETLPSGYKAIPQNEFYNYFESFLDEFGAYDRHIVFNDNDEIETSRFEVTEVPVGDDYTKQSRILKSIKSLEKDLRRDYFDTNNKVVFIFNQSYVFTEADLILVEELLLNLGLAAVGVFVVTLILLVDPRTSLLVVFGIASVDLFLLGELWIGGIRLNTVSVINLVMAVGLSVDYTVHLAHAFVFSGNGGRRERVENAITEIGPAILTAAGTTLVGVIILSGSSSEIARTFFRLLLGTVIYGVWNGMAFTPVMLALVGPASLSDASAESSKKGSLPSDRKQDSLKTTTTANASVPPKSVELAITRNSDTENPAVEQEQEQERSQA